MQYSIESDYCKCGSNLIPSRRIKCPFHAFPLGAKCGLELRHGDCAGASQSVVCWRLLASVGRGRGALPHDLGTQLSVMADLGRAQCCCIENP